MDSSFTAVLMENGDFVSSGSDDFTQRLCSGDRARGLVICVSYDVARGEIRRIHAANQGKLGGRCQTLTLKLNESAKGLGFSSEDTDQNASQGFHAENLLIIEDEACGISPAVDDGLASCLTGENNKILRIGNPIEAVGIHWGEAATDSKQFANSKAEQFWSFREALQRGDVAIAFLDPEIWDLLMLEFGSICYKETVSEKIQIERKMQTIARIGHSPNAADSVVLGFSAKAAEKPKHYHVQASFTAASVRSRCSSLFG